MALLGLDLGGTKLASALFDNGGKILQKESVFLNKSRGTEVGMLINDQISRMMELAEKEGEKIVSTGISVPGISHISKGTVWAPNIPEWEDYPLLQEVQMVTGNIPVVIDSDRACSILGELWQGNARGCRDAIFLAVGTGIGAGILVNGEVLRGSHDIAGATGWMALDRPFRKKYKDCGCFEYYASGDGIARVTRDFIDNDRDYNGVLRKKVPAEIESSDVFNAYKSGDTVALRVIGQCIEYWGMAVANLVSLFNPEKIIFGGGVFGPAVSLIQEIKREAMKWAQPVSITQVVMEASGLAGDAGVIGAGYLALKNVIHKE
jgi:glucokinase